MMEDLKCMGIGFFFVFICVLGAMAFILIPVYIFAPPTRTGLVAEPAMARVAEALERIADKMEETND